MYILEAFIGHYDDNIVLRFEGWTTQGYVLEKKLTSSRKMFKCDVSQFLLQVIILFWEIFTDTFYK